MPNPLELISTPTDFPIRGFTMDTSQDLLVAIELDGR